jgi:hypothetical protein
MKILDTLYAWAQDQSEYILPKELFFNALFFNTAAAMGLKNIRISRTTNSGTKLIIPNYYAISFVPSGAGKNHSRDLSRMLFEDPFARWVEKCSDFNESNKDQDGKFDKKYIKLTDYYVPISSSIEGIQKAAQTLNDMCSGSINATTDELGDVMMKMEPIFTKLKTAWDSGISEGQVNVSDGNDNYFTVTDVCFNALLFGSPAPFELDPKKKDKLLEAYVSGMARRSFIYHNGNYKKSENRNTEFETADMELYKTVQDYRMELRSFINHNNTIHLPHEIRKKLIEWDIQKESLRETSNSLIAEDLGNPKKIEKLLGILATLDLSAEITEEHLTFAINFTELMDKTAEETVMIQPIYMQIYHELEKRSFTARTDIIKAVKDVKTATQLDQEMILVEEHANMVGNSIVKKENSGIITYKLEKLSATSLDGIIISTNDDMNQANPKGFVKNEGKFENIYKLTNGKYRYSAGTFLNGYITDENYLREQNLFIIDIDEGLTIDDAKGLFKDYTYLISTTKSHQKDKHGVVCDRFRLILPTISKFHLEPKIYSDTYMNVLNAVGIYEADSKCRNSSRWYYGNPDGEYWYNQGSILLDIRPYIPHSSENIKTEKSLHNLEREISDDNIDLRIAGALKWFASNTTSGNRNDNVYRFAKMLKDPSHIDCAEWEQWTRRANSILSEPLNERELNTIVRSVQSK